MEAFIQSVGSSFAENRTAVPAVQLAILTMLGLVLALQIGALLRRALARRRQLPALAAQRGLEAADVTLAIELARRIGVEPLQLLGHLDLFERATAAALAGTGASDRPVGLAEGIRRLRQGLGWDRLPFYAPLLTTRELAPGTALQLGTEAGQTVDVDETSFTVALAGPVALAPGALVSLSILHALEARYDLDCRLITTLPGPHGTTLLFFAHDEAPRRVQQRELARVPAHGPILLRPTSVWPSVGPVEKSLTGELVDLGGGGARVASSSPLPVGMQAVAAFEAGGELFDGLRAVVLSSERGPGGQWMAHLEFGAPASGRERLVAAVRRLELRRQAQARWTT